MLTLNEMLELKDKLTNGDIEIELAKTKYWDNFKKGKRSWTTQDWKERRSEIIKHACEICGSKEILTLQHLSHPKRYSEYRREIATVYAKEYIKNNPNVEINEFRNYILVNYEYEPILLCPKCKGRNPNKRVIKTPIFRCSECRHEFDEAIYYTIDELISIFIENKDSIESRDKCFKSKNWGNKNNLSSIEYWLQRELSDNFHCEAIEKEAFLNFLDASIRYLSFENTITACNRCAYNFDKKRMELCPQCRVHYKVIQYPTCIQCLPEEKRNAALEMIEFGKEWQAMHVELGIE